MARAKTSEQSRSRSKAATIEELTRSIGKLQEFLAQVEDLGRDGFPYFEAGRARTELQLRECIRRTFGEKSPEFQEHRHHKLLMDSPDKTQQSIALIKNLIAALEQKKLELQGGAPLQQTPPAPAISPIPARPQMTLVPPSIPTVQMTMMQTAPPAPPPIVMSVAMTTNLDLSSSSAARTTLPPSPAPAASSEQSEPLNQSTAPPESSPTSPSAAATVDIQSQPESRLARPLHLSSKNSQAQQTTPLQTKRMPQPRRALEPIVTPAPAAKIQEPHPASPPLPPHPSAPIASSSRQDSPTVQPLQPGSDPVDLVKTLCCRFHSVARQLRLRGEYRATLSVEDEFDTQDLLHALLRIQFDDIGTDDWTPSYSDGATRTTFLLNDGRLAVIVKKTRPGLNAKDLTDQLQIDAERYRSHDRCTTLLCFMYDPEGRIGNPRSLETALTSVSDSFIVDVLVSPK